VGTGTGKPSGGGGGSRNPGAGRSRNTAAGGSAGARARTPTAGGAAADDPGQQQQQRGKRVVTMLTLPDTIEEALARHRAVLASTLDPVVTIDANGVVQSVSDSIERVFGWKPEEVLGKNVSMLMPPPHRAAHDSYLANYRRTGITNILGRTREFTAVRKDGTEFPIDLSVSRVELPGKPPLFTGIIHDSSDRRAAERVRELHREELERQVAERTRSLEETHEKLRTADRLASIGTLAAGLGHDMNNVLLPVRCRLEVLEAERLPEPVREQMAAIRKSVDYLQNLADGLHLLALDPTEEDSSGAATDLTQWWEQVGTLLARCVPKHARLTTSWSTDLPRVAVPPHRLTQAVLNLLVNAGEAVGANGRIRVEARAAGASVRLSVTDNGHGMPEDVRRRALDPFFTTKKRGLGTGLGLSLVQGVVRSAGGTVEIQSKPGRGTTITLTLPYAASGEEVSAKDNGRRKIAAICTTDQRARGLIGALLSAEGFDVCERGMEEFDGADIVVIDAGRSPADCAAAVAPGTVVVALGDAGEAWRKVDAIAILRLDDFEAVRAAVAAAIARSRKP
jgi:PAS domain S-box-containing protein